MGKKKKEEKGKKNVTFKIVAHSSSRVLQRERDIFDSSTMTRSAARADRSRTHGDNAAGETTD